MPILQRHRNHQQHREWVDSLSDVQRGGTDFGPEIETSPGSDVWYVIGPDHESHSIHCDFVRFQGNLPCGCDNSRKAGSLWFSEWLAWQERRNARGIPWHLPPAPEIVNPVTQGLKDLSSVIDHHQEARTNGA